MIQDNKDNQGLLVSLEPWDNQGIQEVQGSKGQRDSQDCPVLQDLLDLLVLSVPQGFVVIQAPQEVWAHQER